MRRILQSLGRDRRGAAALVMAAAASSVIGMAAFATEAGNWYLVRRHAQNAADAAAFAAIKTLAETGSTQTAVSMGTDVVSRNGFTAGGATVVTVTADTASTPRSVRVVVQQTQPLLLARVLLQQATVVRATSRAVAADMSKGACVLTLSGSIAIGNNTIATAPGCALASNYKAGDAFQAGSGGSIANGSFTVTASGIVTTGGCRGCAESVSAGKLVLGSPPSSYQPPVRNPYAALNSFQPPANFPSSCINAQTGATLLPWESGSTCYTSITLSGNNTTVMTPGTYYIRGGDFKINSGSLTCPDCTGGRGVTIVLTGNATNAIGSVGINTNGTVQLSAPRSNPASTNGSNSDLSGVLIFRDPNARWVPSGGTTQVSINGGASISLNGAVVAPNIAASLNGGSTSQVNGCTVMVVGSLSLGGNTQLSTGGCTAMGTAVPTPQILRLVDG
ncbi:pilus assembly protein TadG-related protein [Siccirubricoccus sp. G192]|uniref:pilus assembly protein TadG-related protein n=1 Tax=Siccirubricoccus sp. G192 TaxID=2849651 RepID=UPI001C2B8E53|nr:pilus assembly protein TadG-related protein [Siccirubricoccus sp. G192]MBV1798603.1 hypothetical protein [Siccirubricoccus sp. G192]